MTSMVATSADLEAVKQFAAQTTRAVLVTRRKDGGLHLTPRASPVMYLSPASSDADSFRDRAEQGTRGQAKDRGPERQRHCPGGGDRFDSATGDGYDRLESASAQPRVGRHRCLAIVHRR